MKLSNDLQSLSLHQNVYETAGTSYQNSVLLNNAAVRKRLPLKEPAEVVLPRRDTMYRIVNRAYDIFVAGVATVLLAPLFFLIAIAIKTTSSGPVMFRQERYGLNGKLFRIYKFRTMADDKGDATGIAQTVENDPRVTAIGRFLRKTSFDELPQIFNILKGEMSVVGPRPHVPGMLANGMDYEDFDHRYMMRHAVRPGLTGMAQVNGYRGETTTEESAHMRLEYDLMYIRNQSLMLDIQITANTFLKEFLGGTGY